MQIRSCFFRVSAKNYFREIKKVLSVSCGKDCYHKSCDWRKTKKHRMRNKTDCSVLSFIRCLGSHLYGCSAYSLRRYSIVVKIIWLPLLYHQFLWIAIANDQLFSLTPCVVANLQQRKAVFRFFHFKIAHRSRNKMWIILFGSNKQTTLSGLSERVVDYIL